MLRLFFVILDYFFKMCYNTVNALRKGAEALRAVYVSDPKGRKFLSVGAFLLTVVILIALNILRLYLEDKFPSYMPDIDIRSRLPERIVAGLMIVLAVCYVVFIVILLPMWYKTIKYTVSDRNITAYSGLFSKTTRIMKVSSVQNVSRISMPLSKVTGFNFIGINALGGRIIMMFLSEKDCEEIIGFLGGRIGAAPVSETSQVHEEKPFLSGKYAVARGSDGQLFFKDRSDLLTHEEINDIANDYSEYVQLSFEDSSAAQLSFNDIENGGGTEQ